MEEIAEGFFRLIVGAIRWVVVDILLHVVCFFLGRVVLIVFTLGRYPRAYALDRDENKITSVGVLVLILAWVAIYLYNTHV